MKRQILFLRLSYWIAAIADFVIAVTVLIPEKNSLTETVLPMGLMSCVAFSWGVLLVFADRKPVERRWILIPTILVVALLTVTRVLFALKGAVAFSWGFLVFGISLMILMVYSYLGAGKE